MSIISKTTVDTILASFEAQLTSLQKLAGKLGESEAKKLADAQKLTEQAKADGAERDRALRVADRISALLD